MIGGTRGGWARSPEAWAAALSVAWLTLAGIGWATLGAGAALALAAILPLGLVWLGAALVRMRATAREDRAGLRAEIAALRDEVRRPGPARPAEERRPSPSSQPVARPSAPPERPAAPPARPRPPLAAGDFIRALNFPEDAEDAEGFAALRRALADPEARRLVQASQDVLTLLSQNGVYMDDLEVTPAPAALWRRFAGGVRGPGVAGLSGVDDESALELADARMTRDTIFRDAAQHFLRQFDLGLQRFVARASDGEIERLGQTRTACAFMILARVAGVFD